MAPRTRQRPDDSNPGKGVRLQKFLADAGVDSRRHCEAMILEGRVRVNGLVVRTLPAFVDPEHDRVEVDGEPIRRPRLQRSGQRGDLIYVMLNKPRRVVSTNFDPEGRTRAIDLVQHPAKARLFPVGRLDADSTGLLLLTNDGELANRLTHPRYEIHKEYEVVVRGALDPEDIEALKRGILLPDRRSGRPRRTRGVNLRLIKRDRDRTYLRMELREGRNRQIRRMMAATGHPVKRLRRVQMGPLRLTGLPIGHWRPLTGAEVAALRKAAFRDEKAGSAERPSEREG